MQATFDAATGTHRVDNLIVSTRLTDDLAAETYLRFKQDKLLETIYYESVPTILDFMERILRPSTITLGAFIDRTNGAKPLRRNSPKAVEYAGCSFVYDRQQMGNMMWKAEVGFGFFRHVATADEKVALGKIMIQALFESFNIDFLYGTTPIDNQAALEYARRVGFEIIAEIPEYLSFEGGLSTACISRLSKAVWRERQRDVAFLGPIPEAPGLNDCLNDKREVA